MINIKQLQINSLIPEKYLSAVQFLEKYEETCTALMEKLLSSIDDIFCVEESGVLLGIFYIKKKATLFHCLPFVKNLSLWNLFKAKDLFRNFLLPYNIFCITGESQGSNFLISSLRKKPLVKNNYFLMKKNNFQKQRILYDSENFSLLQCGIQNANELFPLQLAYQIEEVLMPNQKPNIPLVRMAFEKQLKEQWIFGVKNKENTFVSKANTNAIGKNYAQIGGVYTAAVYRNLGLAKVSVGAVIDFIQSKNKTPVLFVREKNLSARSVYKKLGFVQIGFYSITYF